LAPINVQNVVTYNVVIGVDNKDLRLKPGMTANVSIIVAQKDDVLKAPNAALRFMPPKSDQVERRTADGQMIKGDGGRAIKTGGMAASRTVWKQAGNGELIAIPVQTGISDGVSTEILSDGIAEGEPVIVGIEQFRAERRGSDLPPGFGTQQRPRSRERGM
jgi:HlyD family secretion protein